MLERVVEFSQLVGGVGVLIGLRLQFVGRRGGLIVVGGDFIKFSGVNDRLLGFPGVRGRARSTLS